jgi:hypothetical protein
MNGATCYLLPDFSISYVLPASCYQQDGTTLLSALLVADSR